MKVTTEINLRNFDAWSGAAYTMEVLEKLDVLRDNVWDTLESTIEDSCPEGITDTELNDLLWFEDDTIAEWLGFSDWEELAAFVDNDGDELELKFEEGDIVLADGREAEIIDVDKYDRDACYHVMYCDNGEKEWWSEEDVKEVE